MYRFRLLTITLIAWLFFSMNIERPDQMGLLGNVNIQSFVYVLIVAIPLILLLFLKLSDLQPYKTLLPFILIYALGKFATPPTVSDIEYAYSTIIEAIILLGTFWVSSQLAHSIHSYNDALKGSIFSPTNTLVHTTHHGEIAIRQKIALARRFERDLALIYVKLDVNKRKLEYGRLWDNQDEIRLMTIQLRIAELIRFLLRETDVRAWHHGDLLICLQGSSVDRTQLIAEQIAEVICNVMKIQVNVGIAYFPKDSLVYDDLIEKARPDNNASTVIEKSLVNGASKTSKKPTLSTIAPEMSDNTSDITAKVIPIDKAQTVNTEEPVTEEMPIESTAATAEEMIPEEPVTKEYETVDVDTAEVPVAQANGTSDNSSIKATKPSRPNLLSAKTSTGEHKNVSKLIVPNGSVNTSSNTGTLNNRT